MYIYDMDKQNEQELVKLFLEWCNSVSFDSPNLWNQNEFARILKQEMKAKGYWMGKQRGNPYVKGKHRVHSTPVKGSAESPPSVQANASTSQRPLEGAVEGATEALEKPLSKPVDRTPNIGDVLRTIELERLERMERMESQSRRHEAMEDESEEYGEPDVYLPLPKHMRPRH